MLTKKKAIVYINGDKHFINLQYKRRHLIKIQLNKRTPPNKIKVSIFKTQHFKLYERPKHLLGKGQLKEKENLYIQPGGTGSSSVLGLAPQQVLSHH